MNAPTIIKININIIVRIIREDEKFDPVIWLPDAAINGEDILFMNSIETMPPKTE